ncbi:DNA primase catalytic subunit PriS [Methanobacterium formicicum]|uniref:DNA primase small subunit PriS n=1 Tax=Methanobacterium formicicum TaxID=2162 RepID=A0A089ZHX9_METFO|nr:DNA primase catalytic subunit PriS [Methanobacterium formicicum]AIS32093.1 DNA primase small subunit PriA [Methanobacterium formicicum]CEL24674.1 putative DNA primase small subunit [Methanobacterium formicicum]
MELKPATPNERRQYYREEWDVKNVPDFIRNTLIQREFGFDHIGRGPNDRYRVFRNSDDLRKFMRVRTPFAAYSSVAFYNNPKRRGGWIKAELVFDVDAKDIPIRTCGCDNVCEICLNQAKDIVMGLLDTLQGDLGLKNINVVYSGRGYHIRVLDDAVMAMDSDVRSQIVKYLVGADVPRSEYSSHGMKYNLEHFTIPFGYPQVFTHRVKQTLLNLTPDTEIDDVSKDIKKAVIKNRELLHDDQWGIFRKAIGPVRYGRLVKGIASLNLTLVDAKVSIDLKRILRLPSSLHSGVSMKSTLIKNLETFDPFQDAVPKFVYERDDK